MAEDKKAFDQIKYQNEFNKTKYDRITVLVPKGKKADWTKKAKAEGLSLTAWITKKVEGENTMYPYEPMPNPEVIHTETIRGSEYNVVKSYDMVPYGEYRDFKTGKIVKTGGPEPFYKILKDGAPLVRRDTSEECMAIIEEIRQA